MISPSNRRARGRCPGLCAVVLTTAALFILCASASAGEVSPGWGKWWLPPDRSTHGPAIDSLFRWIFWITMVTFIGVELLLVVFLVKYRDRKGSRKAHFTHGNQKLEMAWTIAPAIILAALAIGSKGVWDRYRYAPEDPNRAKILVIGEQFKWNIIYPGPDGKLGKYLIYPRPTDAKWPLNASGAEEQFRGVPGPASLKYDEAVAAISAYISSNPLGKDWSDPDGKDDNLGEAGRKLIVPAHRQVEVQLSSKDVIHDFFLPNHRVKLDAVPGMRGRLFFEANMMSSEKRKAGIKTVSLDELATILAGPTGGDTAIVIDESAPGSEANKDLFRNNWRYYTAGATKTTIIRNGATFGDPANAKTILGKLKTAGLTEVKVNVVEDTGEWELVCEELCGQGHQTMRSAMVVLSNEEYDKLNYDKPSAPASTPAIARAN